MFDHVDLTFDFRFLDELSVRTHALLGERFGELVGYQSGRVQAGERDELPAVTQLGEALDVGFLLVAWHGGFPVEGWGEVVGESDGVYCQLGAKRI